MKKWAFPACVSATPDFGGSELYHALRTIAVAGNILFVLWILRNGVNEGFAGTRLEVVSSISLTMLLLLNSVLPS